MGSIAVFLEKQTTETSNKYQTKQYLKYYFLLQLIRTKTPVMNLWTRFRCILSIFLRNAQRKKIILYNHFSVPKLTKCATGIVEIKLAQY